METPRDGHMTPCLNRSKHVWFKGRAVGVATAASLVIKTQAGANVELC